jgi:hypothetical protein
VLDIDKVAGMCVHSGRFRGYPKKGAKHMENLEVTLFPLRVLMEYDNTYKVYVARCLETGSVATADDFDTVQEMIKEILEDEIAFAIENDNLPNLYSAPAPLDVFKRWRNAVRRGNWEIMHLEIKPEEQSTDVEDADVTVARAA